MLCVFSPLSFYPIHRFLTHWKCISLQDIDMKSNQSMAVQKFRSRFRNFLVKAMQTCAREMKGNFSFPPGREALKKVVNWCCRPLISGEREEKYWESFLLVFCQSVLLHCSAEGREISIAFSALWQWRPFFYGKDPQTWVCVLTYLPFITWSTQPRKKGRDLRFWGMKKWKKSI